MAERRNIAKLIREGRAEAMEWLTKAHDGVLEDLPEPMNRAPLSREEMRRRYRQMSPEEMDAAAEQAGHTDDEDVPCDLCAWISYEEGLKGGRDG